jgi:hypothetical protein
MYSRVITFVTDDERVFTAQGIRRKNHENVGSQPHATSHHVWSKIGKQLRARKAYDARRILNTDWDVIMLMLRTE